MDTLSIGSPVVLTFSFFSNPIFPVAPHYKVILENDVVILTGPCTISSVSSAWDANITIPSNYVTTDGGEVVTVEVIGTDSYGAIRSVEKNYLLNDAADGYTPTGIMVREGYAFTDSIILPGANQASHLHIELIDAAGNVLIPDTVLTADNIQRIVSHDGVPDRFSAPNFREYKYTFTIPAASVVWPASTYGPHQLNYTLVDASNRVVQFESHPVYRINRFWIRPLNSLRQYLDKARLIEIDQSLQWRDDELCQSLIEGAAYINAFPETLTYWTVETFPEALQSTLWYSAAFHALNARYLAEGLTAFEFQGLSTNLTVDRRESLATKMDEIKDLLTTNLVKLKKMAVQAVGTGESSTGQGSNTSGKALGALGISITPASNYNRPFYKTGASRYY